MNDAADTSASHARFPLRHHIWCHTGMSCTTADADKDRLHYVPFEDAEALRKSHDALVAALDGTDPEAPDSIRPLSWLQEATKELRKRGPASDDEDPSAYWDMVHEVEDFLCACRAVLKAAKGRS